MRVAPFPCSQSEEEGVQSLSSNSDANCRVFFFCRFHLSGWVNLFLFLLLRAFSRMDTTFSQILSLNQLIQSRGFSFSSWPYGGLLWLLWNTELVLHSWDKPSLILEYYSFYVFLNLLIFCWGVLHLCPWEILVFDCMSLSSFGIRWCHKKSYKVFIFLLLGRIPLNIWYDLPVNYLDKEASFLEGF